MMKRTPVLVDIATKMRAAGWQLQDIGKIMGVRGTTIRCWIDTAYRAEMCRKNRRRWHRDKILTSQIIGRVVNTSGPTTKLVQDTRDLTARICGDPLPGRRA